MSDKIFVFVDRKGSRRNLFMLFMLTMGLGLQQVRFQHEELTKWNSLVVGYTKRMCPVKIVSQSKPS